MSIANGGGVRVVPRIIVGRDYGTIFKANKNEAFDFAQFIEELHR